MHKKTNEEFLALTDKAVAGDKQALESILHSIQDMVFNLSLRMLGSFSDAEDATQDILLKIMTHLSSFRKESAFTTWAFSIAVHHLKNYKKHMFASMPMRLESYGDDIENANLQDVPDVTQDVEKAILAEELKMSCTNVMLQCLDPESRCIFILGTMFRVDSRIAGDILEITPAAYRQRLSRVRKKMADFLTAYCGAYGAGKCRCGDRINYAVQNHRIDPRHLDYATAAEISLQDMTSVRKAMEEIDDLSQQFSFFKAYQSPESLKRFIENFLDSTWLDTVKNT